MNLTFDVLKDDYARHLSEMKLTRQHEAEAEAKALIAHRDRFLALQEKCGVPALWVMPVFYREGPSFSDYLGNGDPLDKPTTHVPRGRGPFATWEEGAADALALDHVTQHAEWTWEWACWEWEKYNGMGARIRGRTSGYVWSGTDQYAGGKFIADGVWSRGTWDKQVGCVAIAKEIARLDAQIQIGFHG